MGVTQETSVNHIRYATHIHHLTRPNVKQKNGVKSPQNGFISAAQTDDLTEPTCPSFYF